MKSKNIPVDIKAKSIKEAQNEIKEIISVLEKDTINLEESIDNYNRMIQLDDHIKAKFRETANKINKLDLSESKKISAKVIK